MTTKPEEVPSATKQVNVSAQLVKDLRERHQRGLQRLPRGPGGSRRRYREGFLQPVGKVVEQLKAAGCVAGARVVVEKPFGRDLISAQKLNQILHSQFPETKHLSH